MKKSITALSLVLLASCTNLDGLKKAGVSNKNFNGALAISYKMLAERELNDDNYNSMAEHFAKKGLDAAKGMMVMPDEHMKWGTKDAVADDLDKNRKRLLAVLTPDMKKTFPMMTADAQVNYDCWILEQSGKLAKNMDSGCREKFMGLIARLEDENMGNKESFEQVPVYDHQDIYFAVNSTKIDHTDMKTIKDMAGKMMKMGGSKMVIKGYADSAGESEDYNMKLSKMRAEHVAHLMMKHGVPSNMITVHFFGSNHKASQEMQKARPEGYNRRVEVEIVK